MGGEALSSKTKRLNRDEYFALWERLEPRLYQISSKVALIKAYAEKADFGDMDVLVLGTPDSEMRRHIEDVLNPIEIVQMPNSPVVSLNVEGFQVDLVFLPSDHVWDCAEVYYSYNDLGNLMGKIARYWHLKWGESGLDYIVYDNPYTRRKHLGTVTVTTDPRRAFEFLGFDFDRYLEGFATLRDVFDYISSSTLFNVQCFLPENLSARQRQRDKKRKTVKAFMQYLESLPQTEPRLRPSHADAINRIEEFFPGEGITQEILNLMLDNHHAEYAAKKFNGHHVRREFGLKGKELAYWMERFEESIKGSYREYILGTPYDEIVEDFRRLLSSG